MKPNTKKWVWTAVWILVFLLGWKQVRSQKVYWSKRLEQHKSGTLEKTGEYKYLTVSDEWVEIPGVKSGVTTEFKPNTKNVRWDVRVNGEVVHQMEPINSKEYKALSLRTSVYGGSISKIEVRIPDREPTKSMELWYR